MGTTAALPSASFHSIVVRFEALSAGGSAGMETGYWLYSWLCAQLVQDEPPVEQANVAAAATPERDAAQGWHHSQALSLSPLLTPNELRVAATLKSGNVYLARLTFLSAAAYEQWCRRVWPRCQDQRVRFGPHIVRALDWTEDPTVHPLAQRSAPSHIIRWGHTHAGEALTLRFLTPAFLKFAYYPSSATAGLLSSALDLEVLLPEPDRLVSSLARRWQETAPPELALPADLVELVQHTTVISRFELRSEVVRTKVPGRGFVGWATYRCLAPVPEAQAVMATLWRFATFAGVGSKTSMGMGLTQLVVR